MSKPGNPRIVAFSGPKDGVGKTSAAINLALAWAGHQTNRSVLIVSMDPMCRLDHAKYLNLKPPSLADLTRMVGGDLGAVLKLIKGKIPISPYGVGVLPLAYKRTDILKLNPENLLPVLENLYETYDLFFDVDSFFPIQLFAFDLADVVFWMVLPQTSHLEATANFFNELKSLHFALDRFDIVINQANLPGALAPEEVDKFFQRMSKRVLTLLPWEDSLPEFANLQKLMVVEKRQSEWVKALRVMLGRIQSVNPTPKSWGGASAEASEGFNLAAEMLWSSGDSGGGRRETAPAAQQRKEGEGPAGVPEFWDALKIKLHGKVVQALETERIRIGDNAEQNQEARNQVEKIILDLLQREAGLSLSREQRSKFATELLDEILGLGPLEQIMRDSHISEIMVNAHDRIYIEQAGKLVLSDIRFRDNEQVVQVIKRIVAPIGRRIDESVPLVDARLKDGSRVNAIIAPLAVSGPTLTIRRFSSKPLRAEDLIKRGSVTQDAITFMEACVIIRKSMIISGGTGTGKTTFLNMLSNYIPDGERIITVEDTAELRLLKDHWVRLESRPPNIEGQGAVTIRDLVKNCLRMRPDRIVVGECRGAEALDMLQAMNTGHEGSMATIHANTPRDALTRMEAMCMMASGDLPISAIREMVASAVNMIAQLTRFSDGSRRVSYITEIVGKSEKGIEVRDIFKFKQTGVTPEGKVLGEFAAVGNVPSFHHEFKSQGIDMPLDLFKKKEEG